MKTSLTCRSKYSSSQRIINLLTLKNLESPRTSYHQHKRRSFITFVSKNTTLLRVDLFNQNKLKLYDEICKKLIRWCNTYLTVYCPWQKLFLGSNIQTVFLSGDQYPSRRLHVTSEIPFADNHEMHNSHTYWYLVLASLL